MNKLQSPRGMGFVVQGVQYDLSLLKALGCQWVVMVQEDWMTPADVLSLVQHYRGFGTGLLVCLSMKAMKTAPSGVIPILGNEPDQKEWFRPADEHAAICRELTRQGIHWGGPNTSGVSPTSSWLSEWNATPTYRVEHAYGKTIAELSGNTIFAECGPEGEFADSRRLQYAIDLKRSGKTCAMFQASHFIDPVDSGDWSKGWKLSALGVAFKAAISPASL